MSLVIKIIARSCLQIPLGSVFLFFLGRSLKELPHWFFDKKILLALQLVGITKNYQKLLTILFYIFQLALVPKAQSQLISTPSSSNSTETEHSRVTETERNWKQLGANLKLISHQVSIRQPRLYKHDLKDKASRFSLVAQVDYKPVPHLRETKPGSTMIIIVPFSQYH